MEEILKALADANAALATAQDALTAATAALQATAAPVAESATVDVVGTGRDEGNGPTG